jgi:hypothetical protein
LNFFGHAVAASWVNPAPGFGYGAMLPDLSAMVGAKLLGCSSEIVAQGIDFHHQTDRVFHQDPTFSELETWSRTRLTELGARKGPRRALAHVSLELLLDAMLARTPKYVEAYHRALEFGRGSHGIDLSGAADESGLRRLCGILLERSSRLAPRDAEALVDRLERVLERHPRLRFDATERPHVLEFSQEASEMVEARAESWIRALERRLTSLDHGANHTD